MGIKVSELAQELAQGLSEYSQEVADAIKKATDAGITNLINAEEGET